MDLTLYSLNSKGKPIQWQIKVTDNLIETWDGQVGGKLKYSDDHVLEGKNIGKSNETTPAEQALLMAERKVEMKRRKGYEDNVPSGTPTINASFFNNPPRNFVGPKPKSKLEDKKRAELGARLVYTRKWNGMCVHIVVGDNGPRIFTANMDDKSDSFPKQIAELSHIPPGTWFMAEAIIEDDPDKMKTVFGRSTGEKAQEEQAEMGLVEFKVFNMLYHKGSLCDYPWKDRIEDAHAYLDGCEYTEVTYLETGKYDVAMDKIRANGWEGCVIWDEECCDIPIKWGGSPSRNGGAWKLKNFKEADVLIIDWETGRGKLNDDVATLTYGAYDDSGNVIPLGRGGSGLDAKLRAEIKAGTLPLVAEVKYEEVTKAGKFRLPVILRVRTDKRREECLLSSVQA